MTRHRPVTAAMRALLLRTAVILAFAHAAGTAADTAMAALPHHPTQIIVKLTPEAERAVSLKNTATGVVTGVSALDSLHRRFMVRNQHRLFAAFSAKIRQHPALAAIYLIEVPESVDVAAAAAAYDKLPEVAYAEPDYRVEIFAAPDDPLFPHQWYLNNTGQAYLGMNRIEGDHNDTQVMKTGRVDADIDALEAFDSGGESSRPLVGIIDTGVDTDHEDLADNVWVNPGEDLNGDGIIEAGEVNGIDDDHNGFADDFYGWDFSGDTAAATMFLTGDNDPSDNAGTLAGHGTHCAGIAGAVSNNGIGIAGIAGSCRIVAAKIFPNAFMSVCARAIVYAADTDCDVISMSWGSPFYSRVIEEALDYAVGAGVLAIAAAGNSGGEHTFYPAALPQVFTVGASNSDDEVTAFSTYGEHLEVVAPGEDILSLRADTTDIYQYGGAFGIEPLVHIVDDRYYLMDGTSMAAPCAAGVAAHVIAASPGISAARVIEIMETSADDFVYPYGDTSGYFPGRDIYSGYGRVNLHAALQLLSGRLAKIDFPYHRAIVSGDIAIIGTAAGDNFTDYRLEYGPGREPESWTLIAYSTVPVSADTLGIWSSTGLGGLYSLRLTVGDENRSSVEVIADNIPWVGITSPRDDDSVTGMVSIYGNTVVSDFSHYTVEFEYGESPGVWDTIVSSTRIAADDCLGTFVLNSLISGSSGIFRLTVTTGTGETYTDSVTVRTAGITIGGWSQVLAAYPSMSPAVGDLNGDHDLEVVTGTGYLTVPMDSCGVHAFTCTGDRLPGWPKDIDKSLRATPAVGDLDGDGIDDVVMPAAYLSYAEDWPASGGAADYPSYGGEKAVTAGTNGNDFWPPTPVIADLENDGEPEVLVVDSWGYVWAFRWDGRPVILGSNGKFAYTGKRGGIAFGYPGVAVADLDNDGSREVIVGCAEAVGDDYGGVFIYDIAGNLLLGPEQVPDTFHHISGFAVADIDESDDLEIIIAGAYRDCFCVAAFKKDGSQPPGYPILLDDVRTGDWFGNFPAVGDIEGDGILEIVISVWTLSEARVYAWHQDGTPLGQVNPERSPGGASSGQPIFARVAESLGSPILADINGDGWAEIIARAGYFWSPGYERVMAWDAEGSIVPGFPIYGLGLTSLGNSQGYNPVVSDLDSDGRVELILNTETSVAMQTVVWNFKAPYQPDASPWPCGMHDSWNSKVLGFDRQAWAQHRPPRNLHVAASAPESVTLGWIPKRSWMSIGYNLYRSAMPGQPGTKINTALIPHTESIYEDSDVTSGNVYYYTITNVDTTSTESPPSAELMVIVGRPSVPAGLQATLDGGTVTLTWQANPAWENIEWYRIYYSSFMLNREFEILDSVAADTVYVHSGPKSSTINSYRLTAVNAFSESSPGDSVSVWIMSLPLEPYDLHTVAWADTNVTLGWTVREASTGQGCNVYRATVLGIYNSPPINGAFIPDTADDVITYSDTGLTAGQTYYYAVTQVIDEGESFLSNEVAFLAGRPQTPALKVTSRRESITLHMSVTDPDAVGFRIHRREFDGPLVVLDSLVTESSYVDVSAQGHVDYGYAATVINTRDLESYYCNEESGCLMVFDGGVALVDLTFFADAGSHIQYRDSVNAFYQRALAGYEYTYIDDSYYGNVTLFELSSHPAAIIHSESARYFFRRLAPATDSFNVLQQYLEAGGSLLIEGRQLIPMSGPDGGTAVYMPGDFLYDYVGIDSAFTKPDAEYMHPFVGFIGADRVAPVEAYPPAVTVDTALINSLYSDFAGAGVLPNVDYYIPRDESEILYTYLASDDTSFLHGKPVALRHLTDDYGVVWIGFPLYFIDEDIATQILHAALAEFSITTDVTPGPGGPPIPAVFALHQNYPNPFNPTTVVAYTVARRCHVTIRIFNILGQEVRTLVDTPQEAGQYRVTWNGTDQAGKAVASGVYLYRIVAGDFAASRKMVLLK